MHTNSIFSEKSAGTTSIYIKGVFKKENFGKYEMNTTGDKSDFIKEKAVVRHIFQTPADNKDIADNHRYTIRQGDDRRLRDGVLRVYNIKEPIDIPVGKLLGRWKMSHIGVTVFTSNDQWFIEGEAFKHNMLKPEKKVYAALRSFLRFALA